MNQLPGKRIIVIGMSNAGKSTLAASLAEVLSTQHIDLDALNWGPDWQQADDEVLQERVRDAISCDSWVLSGNYLSRQQHVSWPAADTIVWLDLNMPILVRRCIRRTWRRWRTQERLYGGENVERLSEHLSFWNTDKSLVAHIVRYHRARRTYLAAAMSDPQWAHLKFIRLGTPAAVADWLNEVRDSIRRSSAVTSGAETNLR